MRRASQKAQAVSPGLEKGWLAFVCGPVKRRLAPFPAGWRDADDLELERLCALARASRVTWTRQVTPSPSSAGVAAPREPRARAPRIRDRRADERADERSAAGPLPIASTATSGDSVEGTVRGFAHQARARRLPAIEAMVQLKALLARLFPDADSPARDLRAVRRWFVEAYYFDRGAAGRPADDQSR